ncbi:MAG: hydroxyacid dehydrogenase [Bacteroidales bacterium]|nr:hydroxyacid dehydrogenase [Bacteroidales bacterium]
MNIVFSEPIGLPAQLQSDFERRMAAQGHTVVFHEEPTSDPERLAARVAPAEVLVLANQPLPPIAVERAQRLRLIAVAFTGTDHLPLQLCAQRGIAVLNAAGYSTHAVAELTMAAAIDLLRRVIPLDAAVRSGGHRNGFLGRELHGRTFGVLGLGAIGQRVAALAQAFGCRVLAYSRTPKPCDGVQLVHLHELFALSDVVSLHIPATPQTQGMVGVDLIGLMRPSAVLINTARGSIVDSAALAQALRDGRIAGAALDVYEHEPPLPASHPMLDAPNTLLLPHIGFATEEAIARRAQIVIDNVEAWLGSL